MRRFRFAPKWATCENAIRCDKASPFPPSFSGFRKMGRNTGDISRDLWHACCFPCCMDLEDADFSLGSTSLSKDDFDLAGSGLLSSNSPIQLGVGDLMVCGGNRPLVTVVGSCLALVISAPDWSISGMVHTIYPSRSRRLPEAGKASRLFVDEAIEDLLSQFTGLGILRSQLVLKLFGGASITVQVDGRAPLVSPGDANLTVARRVIAEAGLVITAEDVGGRQGRKVILHPRTGEVRVKRLSSTSDVLRIPQETPLMPAAKESPRESQGM